MKIETIADAIAAIEKAGYLTGTSNCSDGSQVFGANMYRDGLAIDVNVFHYENDVIEFARKCALKVFW